MTAPIDHGEFPYASSCEAYFRGRTMVFTRVPGDDSRLSGQWVLEIDDQIYRAWYDFYTRHLFTNVELPPKRQHGGARDYQPVVLTRAVAEAVDAWLLEQGYAEPEFTHHERVRFGLCRLVGIEPE